MAFYAAGNERLGDSVIDLNLGSNLTGARTPNQPIGVFHEYRADNTIVYVSPNFSGFTVVGAVIPGEDQRRLRCTRRHRRSLVGRWHVHRQRAEGLYRLRLLRPRRGPRATPNVDDYEVLQVGASYTMNNFSVGAEYEDTDNLGWRQGYRLRGMGRHR